MGRKLYTDKLITFDNIKEPIKLIDGSNTDYISSHGNVYKEYEPNKFIKKRTFQNKYNQYIYCGITFSDGVNRSRRIHVLMAKAFITNPDPVHLKIVGHKNNIKWDNRLENLYWTSTQGNTNDAIRDGLCEQDTAEDNKNSIFVKVIDKNTNEIVGVYGSISECSRCISNLSNPFVSKMISKEKYFPRSRKYIYQKSSPEEFALYPDLQNIHLDEANTVDKSPKVFRLINPDLNYDVVLDNQKTAEKITGIDQATISRYIKQNDGVSHNGWVFVYIDSKAYKESTAYQNMINNCEEYIIQNIFTNQLLYFNTGNALKEFAKIDGHDIRQYYDTQHILMNEWKIIDIRSKK